MSEALIDLKGKLQRGDRRELARRLGVAPSRISDCLDGFVKDPDFLSRLQAEMEEILSGRDENPDQNAPNV